MTPLTQSQREATVITTDTKAVRIEELLGKPLVLAFFPAAFTGVCTTEMCTFRDSLARFNDLDAAVYGVSVDLPYSLKEFAEKQKLTFPLLSDANRQAIRAFDIVWPKLAGVIENAATRSVFVIDGKGQVVYRWVAEAQKQEPLYDAVLEAVKQAQG